MKEEKINRYHVPVLLNETLTLLQIKRGNWYIDATSGGGGHTREIIRTGGNVLALDKDTDAISYLKKKFVEEEKNGRIIIKQANFTTLKQQRINAGLKHIAGILLDLGMSTYQIKRSGKGFSFSTNEPLDMRTETVQEVNAADVINKYSEDDLYDVFIKYGEEQLARELAHAVVRARTVKPIYTTKELEALVRRVYKEQGKKSINNPATHVFQALRIEVNHELEDLKMVLPQITEILTVGGRCVCISFHSLEDRIVKRYIQNEINYGVIQSLSKRPVVPSEKEIALNRSARSAKLRAFEKI